MPPAETKPSDKKIDAIAIPDIDMAKAFYACVFGAKIPDDASEMRLGDRRYRLTEARPCAPETHNLAVDDADVTVARIAAKGGRIVAPVARRDCGHRIGRVEDPFGHIWSVTDIGER